MISPIILSSINQNLKEIERNELLETNIESGDYGLALSESDVKDIINSRDNTLKGYGRIELDIKVTKQLIENIYTSQYTNVDNYLEAINDMQEILTPPVIFVKILLFYHSSIFVSIIFYINFLILF